MRRFAASAIAIAGAIAPGALAQNCANTSIGATPLTDLGAGSYLGAQGGMYTGGSNLRPPSVDLPARAVAGALTPLNAQGQPDPSGWIVLLSIGMSNTTQEYSAFVQQMQSFPNRHPRLRIIDGAQGGQDAVTISDPTAPFWANVDARLAQAGLTPAQVQCVWLKEAIAGPASVAPGPFPAHPQFLEGLLGQIARNIKDRYTNTALCHMSSRTYGGYATGALNPEPYAYDSAFAVKWLIERQQSGDPALNWNASAGPVEAPLLMWGPYLWADGTTPRSDGLVWNCSDTQPDGVHPSPSGRLKVADMLRRFYSKDLTTRRWFTARGADLNDDGVISFADLNLVLGSFGQVQAGGAIAPGDANADGAVNFADLNLVLAQFGT